MSWIKSAKAGGGLDEFAQKTIEVTVEQPDNTLLIWITIISGIAVPICLWWLTHRAKRKRNK